MSVFALIILDGWGYRTEKSHNPTQNVSTPTIDYLFSHYPYTLIEASGEAVGLPAGQIGNSEVGHLHIGAGRKVPQDLTRINNEIANHAFFENPILKKTLQKAQKNNCAVHIIGLLSPGGVHSHEDHICKMIEMIHQAGITKNYTHAICDGRDVPPKSALPSIQRVEKLYEKIGSGQIVSVIGRYYAMDRDNRHERTQKACDLFTQAKADFTANTAEEAIRMSYERGETDEFILPTCVLKNNERVTIQNGDIVIFMNFRADRAKQITRAIREAVSLSDYVTLTEYVDDPTILVAYPPLVLRQTLGEYLAQHDLKQLRLAETEKYAHVTYFLNGGIETPNANEDRQLIPSPKIATYDTQPEMSAIAVTDAFVKAIESQKYNVIICNYANPDMIGHTGDEKAAEKAMSMIDLCLKRVLDALQKVHGEALITSDHGNIEQMYDEKTGQPHTAHTTNLVPLIYVGRPATVVAKNGALDDVAPSLLYLMGLSKPVEMTGKALFEI